jgi:GntR family transcriptional regulator
MDRLARTTQPLRNPRASDSLHYRPLYRQVYDSLVRRIANGAWRPGEALPSEQALAVTLGVSQGTVRKALDALAEEKLIERRQGKGTYLAEHTQERALFRFFRLTLPDGTRGTPISTGETVRKTTARGLVAERLGLDPGTPVIEIVRVRLIEQNPAVLERISLPAAMFPGLEKRAPLPNALYTVYQHEYGQNIVAAEERLRADIASREDMRRLGIRAGAPVLRIERVGLGVDGARVELRVSRCNTDSLYYAVTLS